MADQTVFDAARQMRQRTASVEDKTEREIGEPGEPSKGPVPAPGATTFAQARRSERVGEEGERQFGAPVARPEISAEAREEAIRAAQEERIRALNLRAQEAQRRAQSTDLAN